MAAAELLSMRKLFSLKLFGFFGASVSNGGVRSSTSFSPSSSTSSPMMKFLRSGRISTTRFQHQHRHKFTSVIELRNQRRRGQQWRRKEISGIDGPRADKPVRDGYFQGLGPWGTAPQQARICRSPQAPSYRHRRAGLFTVRIHFLIPNSSAYG